MYSYFVDKDDPEYKGDWNEIHNTARVYTPEDTTIQTPNSDTPYSTVGADLRAEPLVLTVPPIEQDRYYSLQFVDLTPTTSTTREAGPPEMAAASTCSPGRTGRATSPTASTR